ncbi:NIF3-like protein [Echinococcus granulosus]|uniref:NIF3-like protein 1 n=1 Tax=Echinococcus granulosus TaxID=6210 RepID=W6V706_ECHGR|nr:NIF3-like protein [Echinococcus granulosus]EUB62209.1 NIF3-like protein [Echinococcus granulosus]
MEFARLAKKLDHLFKLPLAEPWDNVGLLIQPSVPTFVSRICLTNDLTEPVLNEVTHIGANFIISYHPPIFRPLKRLTQSTSKERIIVKCIEHKIAVYSPHTALDAVSGGLNDWLLSPFGNKLLDRPPTVTTRHDRRFQEYCIRNNIAPINCKAASSNGKLSEAIMSGDALKCQEVEIGDPLTFLPEEGAGRIGLLKEGYTVNDAVEFYKALLNTSILKVALGYGKTFDSPVTAVAVCAGSGGSLFSQEAIVQVADLLVTGEASHHEQLEAVARGATIITAGHSVSERGYLSQRLRPWLQHELATTSVPIDIASTDAEPGIYVLPPGIQ